MACRKLSTVVVLGLSAVKNLRFAGGKGSAGATLAWGTGAAGATARGAGFAAVWAAVWAAAGAASEKESTPAPRARNVKPAKAEDLSIRFNFKIENPAFRCRFPRAALSLDLNFDRNGKPAAHSKGFARDFEDGCGLLALVLAALDELEDGADQGDGDALVGGDLFGGAIA